MSPDTRSPLLLAEVQSILEGTGWVGAVRDDNAVAAEIASGEDVFVLDGAAVFDEFFHFLTANGLMQHFETLANRMPGVRENVPAIRYMSHRQLFSPDQHPRRW